MDTLQNLLVNLTLMLWKVSVLFGLQSLVSAVTERSSNNFFVIIFMCDNLNKINLIKL